MKKSIIISALLFMSIIFLLVACNKEENLLEQLESNKKIQTILPQNQALLDLLHNGKSIDLRNQDNVTSLKNTTSLIPSNINVYASGGILSFATQQDVYYYIAFLDYLVDNWDYSNSDVWDDTDNEINHLGDEALNAVEQELGYTSLRSHYNILEYYDEDYVQSLDFYIDDPDYQALMNENHVVRIANNCHVWLSPNIVAIVSRCNKKDMMLVEQFGMFAGSKSKGIRVIDELTGNPVNVSSSPVDFRTSCILHLGEETGETDDWKQVKIDYFLQNPTNYQACGSIWNVNWGDGFSGTGEYHTYNVENELAEGDCKTFTVTVTGTPLSNCGCTIKDYKSTVTVNVCKPIGDCSTGKRTRENKQSFYYNGTKYRIEYELGQRSEKGFLSNPKVWVKAIFKKKKSNGKWRRRKPGKKLGVRVRGDIVKNQCTLLDDVSKSKEKRKKRLVRKHKPNEDFSTLKTGPNRIYGDFYAKMDDTFKETVSNFSMFD